MNLKAFYSGRWLYIKLALAVLVPVLAQIPALFINGADTLLVLGVLMFISALIYALPFISALFLIKREKPKQIRRFITLDALFVLAPTMFSAIICEVVLALIEGSANGAGSFVIIFGILYTMISLVFWGLYLLGKH